MDTVIKLDKSESKIAQFVQRAQSTDDARPILTGMNVNGSITACDGHRLHSIQSTSIPDIGKMEGLTVDLGKVRAGDNLLEPSVIEGKFPEYEQILPTSEPVITFALDPAFLVDACKTLDKGAPVTIKVHSSTSPIELHGTLEGEPIYALIMPMYLESRRGTFQSWRPGK